MPTLRLDGDARGAVRAMADVAKAAKEIPVELDKGTKSAKALERAAADIVRKNEGPQDRYNRKIKELAQHMNAGRLTTDEAAAAAARYRRELEGAMSGRGLEAVKEHIKTFASLAGGIGLVSKALQQIELDAQKAADAIFGSIGSAGQLQQLPNYVGNLGFARSLITRGIVPAGQQEVANDITFNLSSAGFSPDEMAYLANVGEKKLVKPSGLADFGGALRKYQNIVGRADAGDLPLIGNKLMIAAEVAQSDMVPVATAATQFMSGAKALGIPDEQSLAAYLAVEGQSPNAEIAATRLKSFYAQVDKKGLNQGSQAATLDFIQKEIDSGKSAYEVLGEENAVTGFRNIQQQRAFMIQSEQRLSRAGESDLVNIRGGQIMNDPAYAAGVWRQRAEGNLARIEEEKSAEIENLYAAARSYHIGSLKSRGLGFIAQIEDLKWSQYDFMGMERTKLRGELFEEQHGRDIFPAEFEQKLLEALDRQTEALESLDGKKLQETPSQKLGRQE